MSRTCIETLTLLTLCTLLCACGLTQTVTDTTVSATRALFYKTVQTVHLDISARASLNIDTADMRELSVATVVRVYQLRTDQAFRRATYDGLLKDSNIALGDSLLEERSLVIKPGEASQLSTALHPDTQIIAIVALFREPDTRHDTWRLMLTREDLDPDRARLIEVADNRLTLRPTAKD